jgi:hypothetical protein
VEHPNAAEVIAKQNDLNDRWGGKSDTWSEILVSSLISDIFRNILFSNNELITVDILSYVFF